MQVLYKFIAFIMLSFFWIDFASAQEPKNKCITDQIHQEKLATDSIYAKNHQLQQQQTYQAIQKILAQRRKNPDLLNKSAALYNIPVVVHIIHNNGTENISDAQVQQGMQDLNDAFRHEAPYNGPKGVDIEIEFCLAKQDPSGNPTNGINRVVSTLTDHNSTNDLALKDLSRWDTKKYLNIWLVKEICMPSYGCGVAGYAYYASAHGASFDGIVNEARWFGSSKNNSKIHIHEVGHYLNLIHTFDGGCPNTNCLMNGDRVCDTPPDDSKSGVACGSSANTCTTDEDDTSLNNPFRPIALGGLGDQPDMHENYMDYSFQSCQNAFTQGQKDRMIYALTNIRSSLLTSVGCAIPCPVAIKANFTIAPAFTVNVGTTVNFTNASSNATDYEWFVNGATQSIVTNFSNLFTTAGTYQIKLIARNPAQSAACIADTTISINVVCPALTVDFTMPNDTITAGDSFLLINTSSAGTFQWFVNGSSVATSTNYTFSSNTQGNYIIRLEATETGCTYSFTDTITVICPVQAFFSASATDIFTGGTVDVSNASLNEGGIEWFLDNVSQGATNNLSLVFPTTGDYVIKLVASNGICSDTIQQVINVSDPGSCAIRNADIWYFGDKAGLDFTSGTATPIFNSQMYAMEGCSSISNQFGNLLFYSNGYAVWNRNHIIMPNGSGLLGGLASTQSVQIIPKPGSTSTYYIFTTAAEGGTNGLQYSEVEMSLDGGFGDVVTTAKNIPLYTPVAEKLTAVMHENNCDVWLIAHGWNNNQFLAYQITSAGINTTPIVSNEGTSFGFAGGIQSQSVEAGQLKASPNGKKLAMAIRNASTSANGKADLFEIYDFNAGIGEVSNAQTLASNNGAIGSGTFFLPYGVEFSPDNSKVYVSNEYNYIFQFNLDAGSLSNIINSKTNIIISSPAGQENNYYALQLATDAKIYVATGTNKLGVIEKPNALGTASNYNASGGLSVINPDCGGTSNPDNELCRTRSNKGLPPFIPNNFNQLDFAYSCTVGNPTKINFSLLTTQTDIDNIVWKFGDAAVSVSNNTSNNSNPSHDYTATGSYFVTLTTKDGCLCSQITKEIFVSDICNIELASTSYQFDAKANKQSIELNWQVAQPDLWESFLIERSLDGVVFEKVTHIYQSNAQEDFRTIDEWGNASLLYYRLQLIEKTGNRVYSPIQKVEKNAQDIKVYPVPVLKGEDLHLEFTQKEENSKLQIQLTDVLGRVIYQQNNIMIEDNPMTIPTQNLAVGLYHIIIQTATRRKVLKVWVY